MKAANKKEERRRLLKVGIFLTVTVVSVIGIVMILGSTRSLFKEKFYFYAYFDNVGGLIVGSPVYLAESKVGEVRSIEFVMKNQDQEKQSKQWPKSSRRDPCTQWIANPENPKKPKPEEIGILYPRVRVEFNIQKEDIIYLREQSTVELWSKGILGDPLLKIPFAVMDDKLDPPLKNHACISSLYAKDLRAEVDAAIQKVNMTLDEIKGLAGNINQKINLVLDDQAISDIHKLIKDISEVVGDIKQGNGLLHALIYDSKLAENTGQLLTSANQFVKKAQDGMGQLTASLGRINHILKEVQSGKGTLHQLVYGEEGTKLLQDLRRSAASLDDILKEIKTGQGLIHNLVYEKDKSQLIESLAGSAKTLQKILNDIDQGKGTLGGFIKDPSIYRSIKRIVLSVQRGWFLKSVLRSFNDEGEQIEEKEKPQKLEKPQKSVDK